jgi:hypothetical protein
LTARPAWRRTPTHAQPAVIAEIAADPHFLPEEITKEEFEAVWNVRVSSDR